MAAADYDEVVALWKSTEGVEIAEGDDRESVERYLTRNPGFSHVAVHRDHIVGAVMCGHDGRRGLIYHLAVSSAHRGRGIGRRLLDHGLRRLKAAGILRALILVARNNGAGVKFWRKTGFEPIEEALPFGVDL